MQEFEPESQYADPPSRIEILEAVALFMCNRSTGLWEVGAKDRISIKN